MTDQVELTQDTVRAAMRAAMSGYSEERWCASWMTGLDDIVRREGGPWVMWAYLADGWPTSHLPDAPWAPLTDQERQEALAYLAGRPAP